MHRCLELARQGQCETGINPLVGAVLVSDGKIIAEAFHSGFGKSHAERQLLQNFEPRTSPADTGRYRAPQNIRTNDVLYVNLEPCCHANKKTPPCVPLLIKRGVKQLVFGMYDPNPAVAGKGISMLRKSGIDVIGPVLSDECERLNRGFVSLMSSSRPWVTLKNARTLGGRYSNPKSKRLIITGEEQDRWTHEFLRARHDATLVGVGTILADDPRLDVRYLKNPPINYRIILDSGLKIPLSAKVLGQELVERTIIIAAPESDPEKTKKIEEMGARIFKVKKENADFVWSELWSKLTTPRGTFPGISSILLEGGPKTWEIFRKEKIVDEEVTLVGN